MGVLGTGKNTAWIYARGGRQPIGPLDNATMLTWDRRLDDPSQAGVNIAVAGATGECCDMLGLLGTWGHELVIFRDEHRVWEGPLTSIRWGRAEVSLVARDVFGFLQRRICAALIVGDKETGLGGVSALTLAQQDITGSNGWVSGDNAIPYLQVLGPASAARTTLVERNAASGYTADALADYVKAGVHFTTVGRRALLWGETTTIGRTAILDPNVHLTGEVELIEDGMGAATGVAATGDEGMVGTFGNDDGFYGRVEQIIQVSQAPDVGSLANAAQTTRSRSYPAPNVLNIAQDSVLSCDAPFDMAELVAGTLVPVVMDGLCKRVQTVQRLGSVKVSDDGTGEKVAISVEPVAS